VGCMPGADLAGGSVDGEIGHVLSSPLAAVLSGGVWQHAIWFRVSLQPFSASRERARIRIAMDGPRPLRSSRAAR
jgi:hypothetical protein